MEKRKIEEKILWIDSNNMISGTTNNFYYNIGNILYVDNYKKLKVKLVDCVINKNYIAVGGIVPVYYCHYPFNSRVIKIFIDFGVGNNCLSTYGNSLLMGMIENKQVVSDIPTDNTDTISNVYLSSKTCEKLKNNNIKYYLNQYPNNFINIQIYNENNTVLTDTNVAAPLSVLLCLKFTYEF